MNSSFHEKSFSADGSRRCSFCSRGNRCTVTSGKHQFPPLYFHEHVPGEGGRIAWRICHVCPVLPFPRVASGIEEHSWLWCKRSCRIESTLPSLFLSLSLWNGEKVRRAVSGGRFFESKVRERVGRATGDDPSHTYPIFVRVLRRACSSVATNRFPPSLSLSLVTRLMVNGSTGNPLKTSRRKTRNRIDRGENWRRIDCYPDVPRMRIYPRGFRGTTVSRRINRFQPIQYQDYACTLQEVDVQWPRSSDLNYRAAWSFNLWVPCFGSWILIR